MGAIGCKGLNLRHCLTGTSSFTLGLLIDQTTTALPRMSSGLIAVVELYDGTLVNGTHGGSQDTSLGS